MKTNNAVLNNEIKEPIEAILFHPAKAAG